MESTGGKPQPKPIMNTETTNAHVEALHVRLHDLRFSAFIGVLEQERIVASDFLVNLDLTVTHARDAVFRDRLEATVDYAQVYTIVRNLMHQRYQLIERAAGAIGQALLDEFSQIEQLTVDIRKVNPPMGAATTGASVCVTLSRGLRHP